MIKNFLGGFAVTLALCLFSLAANAHGSQGSFSAGGQLYAGAIQAGSSSTTTGGSQFAVSVNSNGNVSGFASSVGGGEAMAGGTIDANGIRTFTTNTSNASGSAQSKITGSATGTGSAAQGTDTYSAAAGQFGKVGAGFGAWGGFGH